MTVLNRSWVNCTKMWKWVSENLPENFSELDGDEKEKVIEELKVKWLKDNKFTKTLVQDCFFCEYDKHHKDDCSTCPANLVESNFHCDDDLQSFRFNPKQFYIRLLILDAKRKEKV